MFLGIIPFLQTNYNTSCQKPKKVNSLQYNFGLQPQDTFTLQKKEFNELERQQYNELLNSLPDQNKKELENLQKNGVLLNKKSNNNSSALENLYKIYKNERAQGLNNREILRETISTLNNPYRINQKINNSSQNYFDILLNKGKTKVINEKTSTCTAACIEFDLVSQEPAEFIRFVEELTSPKLSVDKIIDINNLADKTLDAIWLLNTFETLKEANSFDKIKLTLKPDEKILEKIILDKSSETFAHRNNIDTILQSTFMNVGSQQSYNSLTDMRGGKFNVTEKGLIEFEKTYVESIVRNKNIISVNYQKIDENGQITGYETDFVTIKNQLLDTLALKENIVLGLTNQMPDGQLKGHEIVLTGAKTNINGKTDFYCYNSDSNKITPEIYSEDYLLPRIHHAGLPKEVVAKTMIFQDGWVLGLENYKQLKNN